MAALELALILLATVLASAVIDQLLPHVSLPLIQIACGVVVAVLAHGQISITLNPELFLVMFIAPLLFHEARVADKTLLWRNRLTMLSYAIGLVVAIVLAIGFAVHALIPSIPLAAAFALGAALGPTDPIAVASVSKEAQIPERLQTTLQGESLLNDASGIVSFQFAVAAVVTGAFSAFDAVGQFLGSFFGALALGIVLGLVLVTFSGKVRDMGLDNTTFHVALELITPFAAYLLGEVVGVSGVILVVACGLTMSSMPRDFDPSMARMGIVSSSVWQVLVFAFNGVVFVMLGTQLPKSFADIWIDEGISNFHLIAYVVLITIIMHAVRFIWSFVSDAIELRGKEHRLGFKKRALSAAIMTFSGSKGAITLAIMFSLPLYMSSTGDIVPFPQRDLLIFLASGVILLSLLLATFLVPVLAPRDDDSSAIRAYDNEARADILRTVIEELTARRTKENRSSLGPVIALYTDRLERFKGDEDLKDESDIELRVRALEWEQEFVLDEIDKDEVPPLEGYQYVSRVARIESMIKRGKHVKLSVFRWLRRTVVVIRKAWREFRDRHLGETYGPIRSSSQIRRDIQIRASLYIIERLKSEMVESDIQSEKVSQLITEYERTIALLRAPTPSITALTKNAEPDLNALKLALRIELEQIQLAYDEGRISRGAALNMRENVYLMQIDLSDNV